MHDHSNPGHLCVIKTKIEQACAASESVLMFDDVEHDTAEAINAFSVSATQVLRDQVQAFSALHDLTEQQSAGLYLMTAHNAQLALVNQMRRKSHPIARLAYLSAIQRIMIGIDAADLDEDDGEIDVVTDFLDTPMPMNIAAMLAEASYEEAQAAAPVATPEPAHEIHDMGPNAGMISFAEGVTPTNDEIAKIVAKQMQAAGVDLTVEQVLAAIGDRALGKAGMHVIKL